MTNEQTSISVERTARASRITRSSAAITAWLIAVLLVVITSAPIAAFADEGEAAEAAEASAENEQPAPEPPDPMRVVADKVREITSINPEDMFARHYDWVAVENQDFTKANEDGTLSVWQDGWYIAHDWSDYGYAIADLQPGDAVTVNGQTTLITGKSRWKAETYTNWDIYDVIGWDKYVFQTCLGDDEIWIVYGFDVHPTPEFLAQHGL